jgi:hypothetical protein
MKIFISWSGTVSRQIAEALSDWLQRTIQAVKPFYSPDIDKGAKWSNEIDAALEGIRFGIICLTPDNLNSNWVHYEAGALSKTKDASIWTFLVDLKPSDVKQPLGKFQHTLAEKADVLKMLKSINAKLSEVGGESLRESLLAEIFEESWSKLEGKINKAKETIKAQSDNKATTPTENIRNDNDKLDEILEILRSQQRTNQSKKNQPDVQFEKAKSGEWMIEAVINFKSENSFQDAQKGIDYLLEKVPAIGRYQFTEKDDSTDLIVGFSHPFKVDDLKMYTSFMRRNNFNINGWRPSLFSSVLQSG